MLTNFLAILYSTVRILKSLPKKTSLLDIGCGGGLFLLHLSQYFPTMQFEGADISPAAINLANKDLVTWRNKHRTDNVSFHLQDQSSLELTENSVDVILTTLVCHHLSDDELIAFLKNIFKHRVEWSLSMICIGISWAEWLFSFLSPLLFETD